MEFVKPPASACESCGRPLPDRQGPGRRRRYCDATCRSRARRQRTAAAESAPSVKAALTSRGRHDNLDIVPGAVPSAGDREASSRTGSSRTGSLADAGSDIARRLANTVGRVASGSPLEALTAAQELSSAASDTLQDAVDRARAAGHSWREIGDVLDTTRQAAFQRFGRPVDPRTGVPMTRQTLPGAKDRAVEILGCVIEGRWEDARRGFGEKMLDAVDADRIADGWALTIGEVGRYEQMGDPLAIQAGDATVVNIPLYFEAGERTGRVVFDQAGKVIGLFLLPASP